MGKGLSKKRKKNPHRHRQQYGDCKRERGVRGGKKGKGRINVTERDLNLGGGHTIQYIDDVVWNCI